MKKYRNYLIGTAVLAVSTLLITGCNPSSSSPSSLSTKTNSDFKKYDKILHAYSRDLLETHFIKCGEAYSTSFVNESQWMTTTGIVQVMGMNMYMVEDELTEADKMNGKTLSGKIRFSDNFMRRNYRLTSTVDYDDKVGKWQDWFSPDYSHVTYWAEQKNGKWSFRFRTVDTAQAKSEDYPTFLNFTKLSNQFECDSIPRR